MQTVLTVTANIYHLNTFFQAQISDYQLWDHYYNPILMSNKDNILE